MNKVIATVVKNEWKDMNNIAPMVLLSKKQREHIGVDVAQPVKVVHKVSKDIQFESIAMVHIQFKEFVGETKQVCSINKVLAERLNANVNSKLTISKELTETEYQSFTRDMQQAHFFGG